MDHSTRDEATLRSSPFQARALHFLKKFTLRARGSGGKPRDTVSSVAIPPHNFHHAHSSVDLLRKPDISQLIGFRVKEGHNPMDTDDSSQDASTSSNSHRLRARRYSTLDSLRNDAPIHATFAGHGAPSAFLREQGGLGIKFLDEPVNLLAPKPLFLRSNPSLKAVAQPPRSPVSNPEVPLEITVSPELKPRAEEAVQYTLNDDTAQPLGGDPLHPTFITDLTTSPYSYPGTFSDSLSEPASQDSTSETVQQRPPLLSCHTAPLPPPFRVTTERGLRLSPSIITRQPMPLLNLPTLPSPPPPAPDTPSRPKVPLRSVPLLSRHGRSNDEDQADQENATLGDLDEDEDDEGDDEVEFIDAMSVHQSDDEDDEPPSAGLPSHHSFKAAQKQRMRDDVSLAESPLPPTNPQGDSVAPNFVDFCSKTYVKSIHFAPSSSSLVMYPFSPDIPNPEEADRQHTLDSDSLMPGPRLERRPSLYPTASRSMVNLGSSRRVELGSRFLKSRETVLRSNVGSVSGHTNESAAESEESDTEAVIGRLLRRTSMPSFHPTSDPPPYPTFDPRPKESRVTPHEDEGREWLPPYSNSLYLIAIMPRKMEFSSPGVQAKDRKWRRVVCELEGTTFRVYKCPPGASGAGVLGDWWEKRVGVGDVTSNTPRTWKREEEFERPAKLGIDEACVMAPGSPGRSTSVPPVALSRRRRESQSSMATQSTMTTTPRHAKRMSGGGFLSPFRSSSTTRPEGSAGEPSRHRESRELELLPVDPHSSRSSLSHESSGRATPAAQRLSLPPPPRSATRLSFLPVATGYRAQWYNGEIQKPHQSDLIRAYTLQNAESGLGNDYLKRKNVIRVRLEGEQFLLQAPDVPAVVEWIEGLHAGTSIALDIDLRPMPRGPMFPRRRRRRPRRPQTEDTSQVLA